ncbi:MAG: cation:proton antiporter, partial [Gammaproteobacteria bacterium]|nr:cation:proton antiporter [Gammaproteobacteria bacterium]
MELLPHFPLHLNPVFIFGLTILLGLVGGELATRTHFLPVITGYIIVSFLMGPGGFNIANASVLEISRLFVDISLSLILFELGRHLDFRWLCRDRGLLLTAIAEASFTFVIIFFLSYFLATLSILESAFAATISMSTSPAVVMMIAYDTSSEGPVTRRSLILTSTNNCFALILFTFLLFFTLPNDSILENFYRIIYRFLGSFIFGLCMFGVTAILGSLLGKNKDNQFILFIGIVILTTSLGRMFHLSNMIALFTLGVAARNLDKKHILVEVNFEWLARLFLIVLFVVTGV